MSAATRIERDAFGAVEVVARQPVHQRHRTEQQGVAAQAGQGAAAAAMT